MSLHDEYIDWSLSGNCLATTGPLLDDCGDDDEILDVEETEAPWSNLIGMGMPPSTIVEKLWMVNV